MMPAHHAVGIRQRQQDGPHIARARTDQIHVGGAERNMDRALLPVFSVEARLLLEHEAFPLVAPGYRDQIGVEIGRVGEHRTNAEIVALQIFDGIEDISADGSVGGLFPAGGWRSKTGLENALDLVEGPFGEVTLKQLLDRRLGQMLADQVLARQPVGVEIALDGAGDRLLVRLRAERRLLLHVVQSQNSSKSSTNFQNLATPPALRSGFCEFTSRSSEQWRRSDIL